MGALTSEGVWYPGTTDVDQTNVLMATMADSINSGIGQRLKKLETFVGCYLGLASALDAGTAGVVTKAPYAVVGNSAGTFNQGMTVTAGTVTVPYDGIYNVMFTANFQPKVNAAARLNTYIYINGVSWGFSSALGEANTAYYSNCNLTANYKLKTGDQIDVRVATYANATQLVNGNGSSLSIALVSRGS